MNRVLSIACMALALTSVVSAENAETPRDPSGTYVAMVNIGGVDEPMFDRAVSYVEFNLGTQVTVLPALNSASTTDLMGEADALEPLLNPSVFCIVGIVNTANPEVTTPFMLPLPERRIAVVNARGLIPADRDAEKFARRLEKESIAGIALIAGLAPSAVPDCATYPYRTIEQLDRKSRNLSPPQLIRFRAKAKEAKLAGHRETARPTTPRIQNAE